MQRIESKTLKRFALSFLSVLALPVIFFIYLFMKDFKEIYQNKVAEQAENALLVTAKELDRHIETLYDIVTYNSRLVHFQSYSVANDITGKGIITTLNSEEAIHATLESVYYYNALKPERLYTSGGTYTLNYFAKLVEGLESKEQLLSGWESVEREGWLRWQEKSNDKEDFSLQYIIKLKDKEQWIFTFSQRELERILGANDVATILLDSTGKSLYVSDNRQNVEQSCYELSVESQNGYFKLVRLCSKENLLFEVVNWQNRFWVMVAIVLVVGFFLVLVLTFYNEYPIRQLQKYCIEKVHNIPKNLAGIDVFIFSFKNIEERVALLEQKQIKERLLLQLLLDEHCDTEDFRKQLNEVDMFTYAECYRVIIAVCQKEDNCTKLELCVEQEAKGEYELYTLDILATNAIVMLVGMSIYEDSLLEKKLLRVTEVIQDAINDKVQFYLSNRCERLDGISRSYKQAMMAWQGNLGDNTKSVVYYKESKKSDIPFRYPSDELRLLYDALVEIDFEKASMITDVLIDIMKKHSDNGFVCASLYYDVFNAYYNACAKLEADGNTRPLDMEFLDIEDYKTMIQMIMNVKQQFGLYIDECSEEKKGKSIISEVIEYIDKNITNYELSVSMLADHFDISISNLSHQFKAQMSCTISNYITEKKFVYASKLLLETEYTVNTIAELLGYSQARSFIRKFGQHYGMTPIEYRNKYKT